MMSVTKSLEQCKWVLETSLKESSISNTDTLLKIKIFLLKLWKYTRGRKIVTCNAVIMSAVALSEAVRISDVSEAFGVFQIICLLNGCYGVVWVYSFYEAELPFLVDELLWVSRMLEPKSTKATQQKCKNLAQFAKLVFWSFLIITIVLATVMVTEVPLRSSFPVGHPFPERNKRASTAVETLIVLGCMWEGWLLYGVGFTAAYIEGLYCGGLLMITSLLKLMRESIEECDFANDRSRARNLVRCNQVLHKVAHRCNQIMGTPNFLVLANTFVIGLATCYTLLANKLSPAILISFTITIGTAVFMSLISEILIQANEDIGNAIYGSNWTTGLFSSSDESFLTKISRLNHVRFTILMVQERSRLRLCVESKYIGGVGHAFIFQYFKQLYTVLQALLRLL